MSKPVKTDDASARWSSWRQIWQITHDASLSGAEKLRQCNQVAIAHASMNGDLEIFPAQHPVRLQREQLIAALPSVAVRASESRKNKDHGQLEIEL